MEEIADIIALRLLQERTAADLNHYDREAVSKPSRRTALPPRVAAARQAWAMGQNAFGVRNVDTLKHKKLVG